MKVNRLYGSKIFDANEILELKENTKGMQTELSNLQSTINTLNVMKSKDTEELVSSFVGLYSDLNMIIDNVIEVKEFLVQGFPNMERIYEEQTGKKLDS
ncbi:hypothetical protein [Enterococcus ureasiticus]|uniref:hypothetical protein n=1 Tax=Enterococcus ureasiticus TaxID=903984 RepID=UPI001113007C|nr:hypothetical protein [Enterococcus ureasiticus]